MNNSQAALLAASTLYATYYIEDHATSTSKLTELASKLKTWLDDSDHGDVDDFNLLQLP